MTEIESMKMTEQNQLAALMRQTGAEEFRSCAFFDDRLDCIRVVARDCSVLEERINSRLTVLIDNHATEVEKKYIGFTFKGATHFCREQSWSAGTSIRMTELLDALLRTFPEAVVEIFIRHIARPLVEEENIEEVAIPEGALAA